ncbi:MAG: IS4 family transposase [Candidatus Dormibacteria bacterium]
MAKDSEVSRQSGRLTDHVALGVLSSLIHRDIVDDVINRCGKREQRSRLLPAHVVVYYVLALNLFFGDAYEEVMRQLVNGLRFLGNWRDNWTVPTPSALSQARTRLGEAPLKVLFERIAVPMARAGTHGAWCAGLRVMALDGLVLDVPDTPVNDEAFGRSGNATTPSPFPQVRLVALAECGTHAVVDAAFGPVTTGEQTLAEALITRFTAGLLVVADRNFYSYQAWQQARSTGAQLLWRVTSNLTLPVLEWLPDGSYRSLVINPKIRGRRREALIAAAKAGADLDPAQASMVRVVEYMIDNRPGTGELFCLITTIADHQRTPALDLAKAYSERWEIELIFDEIEIHQTGQARVLRSKTPQLVRQEIWSLLLTHYAIRHVMKDAADTVGTDPDDLSFIRSYRAIRRQVSNQAGFSP